MNKIITEDNLKQFGYVNDSICRKPIKGIVLIFTGLGDAQMHWEDTYEGKFFAEKQILVIRPYLNPWAWMNRHAIAMTDEILDIVFRKFGLPDDTPIVSTGLSMGGLSALTYTCYAARTPVACVTNCPVCDLPTHYGERPDLPRTLYSAFADEEGEPEAVFKRFSPLHLAGKMPDISYTLVLCEKDEAVHPELHGIPFAKAMQSCGKKVTVHSVPDRGHCDLPENEYLAYLNAAAEAIGSKRLTNDKKTRITVQLSQIQMDYVCMTANRIGISPSDFFRMLIDGMIAQDGVYVRRENEQSNHHNQL